MSSDSTVSAALSNLEAEDVLYDQRGDEHLVVATIGKNGITLRQRGTEQDIPHVLFTDYGSARVSLNDEIPVETPEWA